MKAPIPANDKERLAALRDYAILDTAGEQIYDDVTKLVAYICGVPMASISFVDEDRQWFKARLGVAAQETPRDIAFCAHTILGHEPLIVRDALDDSRFADSPLVKTGERVRFYAGFPLESPEGLALGSLCALDNKPGRLTPQQEAAMRALARQVMALLELRRVSNRLAAALESVKTLEGLLPICAWCKRIRNDEGKWDTVEAYVKAHSGADFTHGICPECKQRVTSGIVARPKQS